MKKFFRASIVLIVLLLATVYLSGFYFFAYHFFPKTTINGKDFGFTRRSDLYENYKSYYDNYNLKLIKKDGSLKINPKDIDYVDTLDQGQFVDQNPFYWFLYILVPRDESLQARINYNEDKLEEIIDKNFVNIDNLIEPEDAQIVYEKDKYKIKKEVEGNKVNIKKLKEEIIKSFKSADKKLNLEEKDLYIKPYILSDDKRLNSILEQKNKLNSFKITYDFKDRQEVLEKDELVSLYVDNGEGLLVPDPVKAEDYIRMLASKYDTFKGERVFNATDIGPVTVRGGIYGWSTDILKSTEELIKALENTEDVTLTPSYRLEAIDRGLNDLGNSYVEIDLGRQHMWLYKDSKLVVDTPIVSGNPSQGNGTPTGTGKIWSRERDRYLTGDGWRSFVGYWLPFNWSGCGIHDSSWRSDYGKDIYLTNGSHGCVNTPPNLMGVFYNNTFHGMPVVVYDSNSK